MERSGDHRRWHSFNHSTTVIDLHIVDKTHSVQFVEITLLFQLSCNKCFANMIMILRLCFAWCFA